MTCRQQDCAFAGSKIAPLQDALSSFLFSRMLTSSCSVNLAQAAVCASPKKKGKAKNLKIEQTTKTKKNKTKSLEYTNCSEVQYASSALEIAAFLANCCDLKLKTTNCSEVHGAKFAHDISAKWCNKIDIAAFLATCWEVEYENCVSYFSAFPKTGNPQKKSK